MQKFYLFGVVWMLLAACKPAPNSSPNQGPLSLEDSVPVSGGVMTPGTSGIPVPDEPSHQLPKSDLLAMQAKAEELHQAAWADLLREAQKQESPAKGAYLLALWSSRNGATGFSGFVDYVLANPEADLAEAALVEFSSLFDRELDSESITPDRQSIESIILELSSKQPERMLQLGLALGKSPIAPIVLFEGAEKYGKADRTAAMEVAMAHRDDPETFEPIISGILVNWVATDSVGAAEWAEQFTRNNPTSTVTEIVASEWAMADPHASLRWLDRLPEQNDVTGLARESAVAIWAETAPLEARVWLMSRPLDQRSDGLIEAVVFGGLEVAPDTTLDWVMAVPGLAPDYRASLLQETVFHLSAIDPASAAKWVRAQPQPLRDGYLEPYVVGYASVDPRRASEVAFEIESPEIRNRALDMLLEDWREINYGDYERGVTQLITTLKSEGDTRSANELEQSRERISDDPQRSVPGPS